MNKYDITVIAETKASLCADVVEACSLENEILVACGLYQLLQDKQTRVGSLYLYSLNQRGSFTVAKSWNLPAVLDCRWLGPHHVAVACANGTVVLIHHGLKDGESVPTSFFIDDQSLILSLDCNTSKDMIVCSDSLGNLSLLDAFTGVKQASCQAHRAEGWCVSFCSETLCCSGGDDGMLTFWDIRCRTGSTWPWSMEHSTTVSSSHHQVGITSILPVLNSNLILTGGYDDYLVGHDTRMLGKSLFSYPLGGGVWRLKQHSSQTSSFLAATMYDGFKFFQLNDRDFSHITIDLYRFGEDSCTSTIAYGICWLPIEKEREAVTCTFYDGLIQHWKIQENSVYS